MLLSLSRRMNNYYDWCGYVIPLSLSLPHLADGTNRIGKRRHERVYHITIVLENHPFRVHHSMFAILYVNTNIGDFNREQIHHSLSSSLNDVCLYLASLLFEMYAHTHTHTYGIKNIEFMNNV